MPAGNSSADFAPDPGPLPPESAAGQCLPPASVAALGGASATMSFTTDPQPDPAPEPVQLDMPVCVLIRSVDRPSLAQAVQSVLGQTHARTRVRIVAARGEPLRHWPPPGALPDERVEVLVPEQPLARSAAANRLLQDLGSEFALFLDDDDWLLPGHLQRLVQALHDTPGAVAAHAGVRCVGGDREAPHTVHVYDDDVRWGEMQLQNRLPIHAVLFRVPSVERAPALRFDESLEHFEDWDFWLRLMARGDFVRVPGVSALYWIDEQAGSGHSAQGSALRARMLQRLGEKQLARWTPADIARLIESDAERTRQQHEALQQLEGHLASSRQRGSQLEAQLADAVQRWQDEQRRHAETEQALQDSHRQAGEREQALAALQAHAEAIAADRDRAQADLAAHRTEVALLAALREEHLQQIAGLHARIAGLYASTSWRLTRPVRLLGRAIAWGRSGRAGVLWRNGWQACRTEVRRKGLLGFLRRAPRYLRDARRHARTLSADVPAPGANPFAAAAVRPTAPVRLHPEIRGTDELIDTSVSVVIPTLNGGVELDWLVRKLLAQRAVRAIEVVIVDSGSTDGSHERARAAGARVIEIPPSEFSHSHARNLGARHATGEHLLFMVQDAYPIGELWLYGMLRYLIDHRPEGVVAASCAEYSRSDSDAMYDCMINTHYRFLGCLEADRIGRHTGDDHMSLRSMGQLSDVACLIPRELFLRHGGYRGDYAEDLDLGMRLIRAGHRIAMLASVKVVHSHNRPAWYYLKRSFVDVIFLVGLFDDFHWPACESLPGFAAGVRQLAHMLSDWLPRLAELPDGEPMSEVITRWIAQVRQQPLTGEGSEVALGDARVDEFVRRLLAGVAAPAMRGAAAQAEAQRLLDSFIARLDHFNQYAQHVYGGADERLRRECADAVRKTFAATLGAALAYLWLDRSRRTAEDIERQWIGRLHDELKAGV
jgi:glycosyltransferase involved in cell wall biosynthesis